MTLATSALKCAIQLGRANANGTAIADLEGQIKQEIGETIRFYNRQKYALTEFRGVQLTTVSGTTWYSSVDMSSGDGDQDGAARTAVDVSEITYITYMRDNSSGSTFEPMERIDYRDFERLFEGSTPSAGPNYFTVYAGQIGLWPTPDDAYTIYFSAHVRPVVPTLDGDTSIWLDEAEELITAGACKRVCLKHLRNTERAAEFGALEAMARANLANEYTLKTSSGRLMPRM